nr:MAG TPA: peptidase [Microviridae sp.]DAW67629.1 MAG TPA: peptidase [Microviridae sp.]
MEIKAYVLDEQADVKITKYFKVKEFACKDGSPIVFVDEYLAILLDILRETIKKPVIVTSGYRTPEHNKKVGGAKYSYHMRGMAADITVKDMTPKEVAKELDKLAPNSCGIIVYKSWVHFDTRNSKYRKGV